jgi:hypothetical protein
MNACVYCDPGGEAVVRKAILGPFFWLLREGAERPSHRTSNVMQSRRLMINLRHREVSILTEKSRARKGLLGARLDSLLVMGHVAFG